MKRFRMAQVIVLLVLVSFGISGCVGFKPFPLAARSGDTVSLALGGSPDHEVVPGNEIRNSNLTITIEQDINGDSIKEVFSVKKRYLFRLYPDPTSNVANFSSLYGDPHGEWIAVINLRNPTTGAPLPLIPGDAVIKVQSPKLYDSIYNNNYGGPYEGSLQSIPITILEGTGQSHTFNNNTYGNISELQPLPQCQISLTGASELAAAEIDIDYDESVLVNGIKIRPYLNEPDVVLYQNLYWDDIGNAKLKIMLMTNNGTRLPEKMKCFIVWYSAAGTVTSDTFNVTSAKFYDESGAEMTGISVVKNLLYQ